MTQNETSIKDDRDKDDREQLRMRCKQGRESIAKLLDDWRTDFNCPSMKDKKKFVDGTFLDNDFEKDKSINSHLKECVLCRADVYDLNSMKTAWTVISVRYKRFFLYIIASLKTFLFPVPAFAKPFRIPAFAALCLCFLVWIFFSQEQNLPTLLNSSYRSVIKNSDHSDINRKLLLPWEDPKNIYGFTSTIHYSSIYRSFGAGLWTGRNELSGGKGYSQLPDFLTPDSKENEKRMLWQETEWADYFFLGNWLILLESIVHAEYPDMSKAFWKDQLVIVKEMEDKFGQKQVAEDAEIISNALKNIKTSLLKLNNNPSDKPERQNIKAQSKLLISIMNPETVDFWIKKYGLVSPKSDKLAERSFTIFERLLKVADKKAELTVINSDKDELWAIALPHGNIVVSRKALELCSHAESEEEQNARIAFLLGHELAHIANNDFWHLNTYMSIANNPARKDKGFLEKNEQASVILEHEIKADDNGFMYAAISGYHAGLLLGDGKEKKDFFTSWTEQAPHKYIDKDHPSPEERAFLLQNHLKEIQDKIYVFKKGVRLAHFQYFSKAIREFSKFLEAFPSREVHNNIGYCYLQLAIMEMPYSKAYEFWFPGVLDIRTQAESASLRGGAETDTQISEEARNCLENAIKSFNNANELDDTYIPSRINLAAAWFYLGELGNARKVIQQAIKADPDNLDIKGIEALILYKENSKKSISELIDILAELLSKKPAHSLSLKYNIAILLERENRMEESLKLRKELAGELGRIPNPLHSFIDKSDIKTDNSIPWKTDFIGSDDNPVPLLSGTAIWEELSDESKKKLSGSCKLTFDDLQKFCPDSLNEISTTEGTLFFCNPIWTALEQEGELTEIWINNTN